MATTFSEIVKTATTIIDDVRDREQLSLNPAVFYRRYSGYIEAALPLLSRPPELYTYLRDNMVYSSYDSTTWTSTEASLTDEVQVSTDITGYDLCSVVCVYADGTADPYTDFTYDSETGIVTFGIQTEEGLDYDIDFYNDGYISTELTPAQLRLFALAISVVWNERFENDWLTIHPKVKDSSFKSVNEPGFIGKVTERQLQYRQRFSDELRKYEQDVAYMGFSAMTHSNELNTMFATGYEKTTRAD